MRIILISFFISLIAGIVYAQTFTIENKTLIPSQYSILKTALINKYQTKGFFTLNEWQTYVAVLNLEAQAGKLKLQNVTKQNLLNKIMDTIK